MQKAIRRTGVLDSLRSMRAQNNTKGGLTGSLALAARRSDVKRSYSSTFPNSCRCHAHRSEWQRGVYISPVQICAGVRGQESESGSNSKMPAYSTNRRTGTDDCHVTGSSRCNHAALSKIPNCHRSTPSLLAYTPKQSGANEAAARFSAFECTDRMESPRE